MGRTGRFVVAYLTTVTLVTLAFFALPADVGRAVVPAAIALVAAAGILVGVSRWRPPTARGWFMLAAACVAAAAGDFVVGLARLGLYSDSRPSAGDGINLVAYLLILAGVFGLLRDRVPGNRRAGLLDALLAASAASMLAWTFLVRPTVEVTGASTAELLTVIAYPLASVILLAVATPLWFAVRGKVDGSARILVLAMLVMVATNVAYGFVNLTDLQPTPGVQASISAGWLTFYLLLGLAGLHPAMASPPKRNPDDATPPSWKRFAVLIVFAGIAPVLVVVGDTAQGRKPDLPTLVVGAAMMITVVITRISDIQSDLRRALRRERTLRTANDELVTAVDVTDVRRVLVTTTELLIPERDRRVWLVEDPRIAGFVPRAGEDGPVHVFTGEQDLRSTLDAQEPDVLVVAELPTRTGLSLALAIATPSRPSREVLASLDALVQCAALAVDRVSLGHMVLERQSEARLQRLLQDASDVVMVMDRRLFVRYVTPAVESMLGRSPASVVGSRWLDHVRDDDRDQASAMVDRCNEGWPSRGELRLEGRDGGIRYVEVAVSQVAEADGGGYTISCHDITDRHDLEEQLTHQAFHDALTGLANRALFQNRLHHTVDRARRSGARFAVLFIDVDDFKTVNDSLGHATGDTLLRTFAARLRGSLRKQDTAARLGGDEFAIIVDDVLDDDGLARAMNRLVETLAEPVQIGATEVPVAASIGVAFGGADTDDPDELMRNADLALYEAKAAGKNGWAVFQPEMHANVVDHLQLKAEMSGGLSADEFVVRYQPLFRLDREHEVMGVEALVRWQHPTRGLLKPGEFVRYAEDTGLVVPLGRMVLQTALTAAAQWHALPGHEHLTVAVNLSGRQLADDGIIEDVQGALESSGVDPSTVVLEITESILLPDGKITTDRLRRLTDLGVRLYVDDFGTGYSSLAYLRDLPVSGVKLAREFVEVLPGTARESGLVRTIHDLARTLGLEQVVAEGIETRAQLDTLVAAGYTIGQGYYLGRPTDVQGVCTLLAARRRTPAAAG